MSPNAYDFNIFSTYLLGLSLKRDMYCILLYIPSFFDLSFIYSKSKPNILYPVIMSGFVLFIISFHFNNNSFSVSHGIIFVPSILSHDPNVIIILLKHSFSLYLEYVVPIYIILSSSLYAFGNVPS